MNNRVCTEGNRQQSLRIEPGEHQLTVVCPVQGKPTRIVVGRLDVRQDVFLLDPQGEHFFTQGPSSPNDGALLQLRTLPMDCDGVRDRKRTVWDPGIGSPPASCCYNGPKRAGEE